VAQEPVPNPNCSGPGINPKGTPPILGTGDVEFLIAALQTRTGMSRARARRAVRAFFESIKKGLPRDRRVSLESFGNLVVEPRQPKRVRSAALRRNVWVFKQGFRITWRAAPKHWAGTSSDDLPVKPKKQRKKPVVRPQSKNYTHAQVSWTVPVSWGRGQIPRRYGNRWRRLI